MTERRMTERRMTERRMTKRRMTERRWPNAEWPNAKWPNAEWPNAEWPNTEWPNAKWPNAEWPNDERQDSEWPNAELDPRPNRDPTPNDQTPNDQTPKGTERRIGMNTEFKRRKTEHRKLLHGFIYYDFNDEFFKLGAISFSRSSVIILPKLGRSNARTSNDPAWGGWRLNFESELQILKKVDTNIWKHIGSSVGDDHHRLNFEQLNFELRPNLGRMTTELQIWTSNFEKFL